MLDFKSVGDCFEEVLSCFLLFGRVLVLVWSVDLFNGGLGGDYEYLVVEPGVASFDLSFCGVSICPVL